MANPTRLKVQQQNHPQRGSRIKVDPIRELAAIESIKKMLESTPRDYLLFVMGINNGLRAGDLLQLHAGSFRNVRIGDTIPIREQKTDKPQEIVINKPIKQALVRHFEALKPLDEDYLFKSRKGSNKPITVQLVNLLVKRWCKAINLEGNFGSHTLRKTFGYILRRKYGVGWEIISRRYNHSSPSVTRAYLGVQDEEVNQVLVQCAI
ncbi:MAG: site-specific integrase [Acidobacteriota bacterium]|jgi:integrase